MDFAYLYRFQATFTELFPIGTVPEGLRLDAHYSGSVLDGDLAGATVRGIDYVLFRPDGLGVLDVYGALTGEHGNVSVRAGGYLVPPPGFELPPQEVLHSPEFQWPDIALPFHGFAQFRTGADQLDWLNRTLAIFEGEANPGLRTLMVTANALVPAQRVAA